MSANIFHKIGKRLIDPYAKREITLFLDKPIKKEPVVVPTQAVAEVDPLDVQLPDFESSPLDLFVEQFQRDLRLQDNVQFVDRIPEPIKPEPKPEPKLAPPKLETPKKSMKMSKPIADSPAEPWTHEKFWRWASGLGWADRTDGHNPRMAQYLLDGLTKNERTEMMKVYTELFETMKETLKGFLSGYDMNETNRDILVSHVIAKGEEFYMAAAADPDFLSYLITDANAPAQHNDFVDFGALLKK